ncbi:hypothetical protein H4S00_005450 [Coemansia sp. D1744]|nr:hypothetical protein H4S00_005450 [Coemansia sp. D1744]
MHAKTKKGFGPQRPRGFGCSWLRQFRRCHWPGEVPARTMLPLSSWARKYGLVQSHSQSIVAVAPG